MPSSRHLRRRISSVKNTEQITRAMKMVAAAKFRKAQEAVLAGRPYAQHMRLALSRLARNKDVQDHPLLAHRDPVKHEHLIVLTSDRGLCGSFNSNVLRAAEHHLLDQFERDIQVHIRTIGRKGFQYMRKQDVDLEQNLEDLLSHPNYRQVIDLAEDLAERFKTGRTDRVSLVFNEFRSAIQQQVVFRTLLPLQAPADEDEDERDLIDYIYEPDQPQLIDRLVHRYLANQLFTIILESVASEHGARMTAMENASTNAADMIQRLTLEYNKARQAAITTELMEIVSGAEALKSSAG
jgi:F-type H+-transporting ATPase subunit gamma